MKLIDANVVTEAIEHIRITFKECRNKPLFDGLRYIEKKVNGFQIIDAVPIVRCKDCIYRGNDIICPMCYEESYDDDGWTEYIIHDNTNDDGFCQCGKSNEVI